MSKTDDILEPLLHAICFDSVENPNFSYDPWIKELRELFEHGKCKDCYHKTACAARKTLDDKENGYCNEFMQDRGE